MTMPGRNSNSNSYRYAYNGMETDNELKGDGNSYTTEFRQYDPRLGRWLSLDPLMAKFPWMSPYVAFDNNPILFNDPLGLETEDNITIYGDGTIWIEQTNDKTDKYIFHDCDGNETVLLENVPKSGKEGSEMVQLPTSTSFYQKVLNNEKNYLPQDAAGGFLGAAYTYSQQNNGYKVRVHQLMTIDGKHSGKNYSRPAMDIGYVGDANTPWSKQAETNLGNVDAAKSNELANTFRQFGFNDAGSNNVLSENANGSGPFLENSDYYTNHQNHFHVQGWSPSNGAFSPIRLMVPPKPITAKSIKKMTQADIKKQLQYKLDNYLPMTEFERGQANWWLMRPNKQ